MEQRMTSDLTNRTEDETMQSKSNFISRAGQSAIMTAALIRASGTAYAQQVPLTLLHNITIPEISGDFDFLTIDLKRGHLFAAAEEHHTIEVFDAATGKQMQSIPGVKTPHALAYVADRDELFIADGGDSSCIILSGADFHQIDRIPLIDGSVTGKTDSPDAGFYDAKRRIFFLGNGGKSANLPYSEIAEISVDTHKILGRIRVEANNVEAMMVDDPHNRLYTNLRDQKKIAVIDLKTLQVVDTWTTPELNLNTSLVVDSASQRLFIAGRKPGLFYAFDMATGKVVDQHPVANISDGMAWDPQSKRIFILASQGLSVLHQDNKDHYTVLTRLPTNGGKTGLYVPQLKQLYVIHPKTTIDDAGLLVYRVNP
jgi:DNA-binding beta-propeller fold protein YncE